MSPQLRAVLRSGLVRVPYPQGAVCASDRDKMAGGGEGDCTDATLWALARSDG